MREEDTSERVAGRAEPEHNAERIPFGDRYEVSIGHFQLQRSEQCERRQKVGAELLFFDGWSEQRYCNTLREFGGLAGLNCVTL